MATATITSSQSVFPSRRSSFTSSQLLPTSSLMGSSTKKLTPLAHPSSPTNKLRTQLLSQSTSSLEMTPKQSCCVDMLTKGFVHSYVDFFYLTHANNESDKKDLPESVLKKVQDYLTTAESSERNGEHKAVIQSYKNLAILYEELDNVTISTHFHQRCLEIAQSMGDLEEEGSANEQLGLAFQRTGDITKAIKYFEFFGHLAKKVDNKEDQSKASKHLMNAYRIYAEQCEEREDYKESVVYLKKCLEQAQACGDIVAEGSAHYKIGNTYQLIGSQEQRIHHLSAYLDICRKTGDETGEGVALSTLAVATKDNTEVSIKYLKENIELAQRTKQTLSLANACKDLAIIYNSTGQYEEAVKFFEQYFTLAKEIGDSKLIDTARVFLGIAKGNAQVSSMLKKTDENNLFNGSRAVNL